MKSIIFIRHARSSGVSSNIIDYDRPLNLKGINEAELAGDILLNKKTDLDIMISSTANRAISTARIIGSRINIKQQIKEENKIYGSSSERLLNIIISLNDNIHSAAFVGHNPALHIVSEELSGEKFATFPTCTIVKINFDIKSWGLISNGKLEYCLYPD